MFRFMSVTSKTLEVQNFALCTCFIYMPLIVICNYEYLTKAIIIIVIVVVVVVIYYCGFEMYYNT